ncbi:MAG: nitrogenase iron protein NifH [Sphaerochaeta sp.]|jgi:nitrogenase iron protein NifH|nr:nitrogenase iron protein NifH [Sphaerochaeta sp.]
MYKIAIYGKGGIGKSTTACNLSAALSVMGYHVIQIGCDPKSDSVKNLMEGQRIPTVLDQLRENENADLELSDIVFQGFNGVWCVEAGGPTPGIGCAGRGIITAFQKLDELHAKETYHPDVIIYDVLGDVVCGGFAMPIRSGYAHDVFIVTSGEMMALYAADNIVHAIRNFGPRGYAKFSGVILNREERRQRAEHRRTTRCVRWGVRSFATVPRDGIVQQAEGQGKTVIEAFPDSPMADVYRTLAKEILAHAEDMAEGDA